MRNNISVVITIKEYSQILLNCISSFINQILPPKEIILVGRKDILYKLKDRIEGVNLSKLSYIQFDGEKNEARNKGVLESKGRYVIYIDQDMVSAPNLIKRCESLLPKYDALIIPEHGFDGEGFNERIFELEKKIILKDKNAQTPRLFRKNLFKNGELPFDSKFGVLDEWGFFLKLKSKRPKIGVVDSFITVKEQLGLRERLYKNFKKGFWATNLIKEDRKEGLRRINPLKRGSSMFLSNPNLFRAYPLQYIALFGFKLSDLSFFLLGYLWGTFYKTKR